MKYEVNHQTPERKKCSNHQLKAQREFEDTGGRGAEERVRGRESRSDGETESDTHKEVSSQCVDTAEEDMLPKA